MEPEFLVLFCISTKQSNVTQQVPSFGPWSTKIQIKRFFCDIFGPSENHVSWWRDLVHTNWFRKCSKCASLNDLKKLSKFCQHFPSSCVYMRSGLSCPGLGVPAVGGCYQGYLTAWHWWLEGDSPSLPVSFASLQYLSFRMNAALLGCLCLVKTPFLFPTTRVNPADTRGINKKPD